MDKILSQTDLNATFTNYDSHSSSEADDINVSDYVPSDKEESMDIIIPHTAFESKKISIYGEQTKLETIENVPYVEPSEYEIKMLEGTIKPDVLLKQEEEELEKQEDEEALQLRQRHQYITMVKVLALVKANKQPLDNPSVFNKVDKMTIINNMDEIMNTMSPDEIKEEFHKICNEKIFTPTADYSTFAITCGK
jgi:hypothetical protein